MEHLVILAYSLYFKRLAGEACNKGEGRKTDTSTNAVQ
jgi:hypothetical protein